MKDELPADDQELARRPMAIRFRAAYGRFQVYFEVSYAALGVILVLIKLVFPH